ncbi:PDZ/DHR/GLGF domain protein [Trichuris suis]|nr:PDZ/DHR/GLGF domain protein [Trichuris suis]
MCASVGGMEISVFFQDIMMDHNLRTISYIADIGDLLVLMARRVSQASSSSSDREAIKSAPKMICHVFESEEAQFIAQSIGQAFQVAYMEFLRSHGIEEPRYIKEMDYQEVLNSQEIYCDELEMFSSKEMQKDIVIPKKKDEPLGVVVVESGWGSMLPTVVVANMLPEGPAARCKKINIGDHVIALNGISFVGLPLHICQSHIKVGRLICFIQAGMILPL